MEYERINTVQLHGLTLGYRDRVLFTDAGIDLTQPIVTSCGSGVTAAVVTLALESLGHSENSLYDGSWSEWGMYDDLKVEKG